MKEWIMDNPEYDEEKLKSNNKDVRSSHRASSHACKLCPNAKVGISVMTSDGKNKTGGRALRAQWSKMKPHFENQHAARLKSEIEAKLRAKAEAESVERRALLTDTEAVLQMAPASSMGPEQQSTRAMLLGERGSTQWCIFAAPILAQTKGSK